MAYRTFTDADGVDWNVWTVIPQLADRRTGKERRGSPSDDPAVEKRRTRERRRGLPDHQPRIKLHQGLEGGWLAFESFRERRRLAPIPPGWETASDWQLDRMCRKAVRGPAPRRLIE